MTTYDFGDGPVPAHQHPNGGGWVADAATVSDVASVGPKALVAGGDIWGGVIRGGVIYGSTIWGGAIFGGTIHGGKIYGGIIRGGTIWGGAIIRGGVIWGGEHKASPCMAQRSDGYCFIVHPVDGELRVWAGCHNFSWPEAIAHWNDKHRHGRESQRIIHFLRDECLIRYPELKEQAK